MRVNFARLFLVVVFVGGAVFDTWTFFLRAGFHIYESNPVYLFTKSVFLLITVKWLVVSLLVYFLWYMPKRVDRGVQFLVVICALYFAIFQVVGGFMNLAVQESLPAPDPALVLEKGEALKAYTDRIVLPTYLPMLLATLAFKLHEWARYE